MKMTTPYNFVPLSGKVYTAPWAGYVSQDVPFSDGEDGSIEIEIKNVTPLFVRDGDGCKDDDGYDFSAHIMQEGKRRYFIPGTSLKGCFRSVLEIISFSHLSDSDYNNDFFGYRNFNKDISDYPQKVKGATCGWLEKREDIKGNEEYFIRECSKGIKKIPHKKLRELFPGFNMGEEHKTAQIKQESIKDETGLYPLIYVEDGEITYKEFKQEKIVPEGDYRIVCTGFMAKKGVEYLFSESQNAPVRVSDDVIDKFFSVHKTTPYFAGMNGKKKEKEIILKDLLDQGEQIPVFFKKEKGTISCIGITSMFKYPYDYSIKDAVKSVQQRQIKGKDLATTIFGYIGKDDSLKGRVQISSAFISPNVNIEDACCDKISAVLGQPHPSFYPLYLQQVDNGKLVSYSSEGLKIGGRKRYRIVHGDTTLQPNASDKENVKTKFRPIPCGNTFKAKINVHNLKKVEIGAILSAITFNMTPDTYHGIGMAKNLGYGKCSCSITGLKGLQYSVEDYIKAFNLEMSLFLQDNFNSRLSDERSLEALVSIASDTHSQEEMKQMELKEFEEFKKSGNFEPLREKNVTFNLLIDENEACALGIANKLIEIDALIKAEDFDTADSILDELHIKCIVNNIPVNDVEKRQQYIKDAKERIDALEEQKKIEAQAKAVADVEAQKYAELKEKYGDSLEVLLPTFKYLSTDLLKWTKVNKFEESDYSNLRDFLVSMTPKELKSALKKKGEIKKAIGTEFFDRLMEDLKNK